MGRVLQFALRPKPFIRGVRPGKLLERLEGRIEFWMAGAVVVLLVEMMDQRIERMLSQLRRAA